MALASRHNNLRVSALTLRKPFSGVAVQRGEWVWNEPARDIHFVSKDCGSIYCGRTTKKPTIVKHSSHKLSQAATANLNAELQDTTDSDSGVSSKQSTQRQSGKANGVMEEEQLVSLSDVKFVAVEMLDGAKVQRMSKQSAMLFDSYFFKTEQSDVFLWDILVYFERFLAVKELELDKDLTTPGELGRRVRSAMKKAKCSLSAAINQLAQSYSMLILAIGSEDQHHSMRGRLKASRSKLDLELFEAIYEFTLYVTWITFHKRHWDLIHKELGRIFRTDAFKCLPQQTALSMERNAVPEILDTTENDDIIFTEEDELNLFPGLISKQERQHSVRSSKSIKVSSVKNPTAPRRPPVGCLGNLRSPIIVSLLPHSVESASLLFVPPNSNDLDYVGSHIGIIGRPLSNFDTSSLTELEKDEDEVDTNNLKSSAQSYRTRSPL